MTNLIDSRESSGDLEPPPSAPKAEPIAPEAEPVPPKQPETPTSAFGIQPAKESDSAVPYAPSSISAEEGYDIAYAHARESSQTNLLEVVEKEMIRRSLKESGGNQVKASAMLGITRATLRKRIDAYEIRY